MSGEEAGDICKCGHFRYEHDANGCKEYHAPKRCVEFRLCFTADEMSEAYDEWEAECEARGV